VRLKRLLLFPRKRRKENSMERSSSTKKVERRTTPKPNNIVTVPTSEDLDFFKWWCVFLRPFINLTNREIDVIASFLKQRWELSKNISDPAILDTMVMSEMTKNKVIEECNITQQHFYVVMSNLRKNNVIVNNTINPRLVPNIRKDDDGVFQLLILFKGNKKKS
jgi:predicted acylesterase/phospholipase RssA